MKKGFDCIKVYDHLAADRFEDIVPLARQVDRPVIGHVPPMTKLLWESSAQRFYLIDYPDKTGYQQHMVSLAQQLTYAMHQSNVKLLIVTDTNIARIFPGISTLKEMCLFVEAGISRTTEALP